jgi:hypothetical protein
MIARLQAAHRHGFGLRTTAIVLAQVWRDSGGRQIELARLLRAVDVRPVDERLGRESGILLGLAKTSDPTDATIVLTASNGDRILTSDPRDLKRLTSAARKREQINAVLKFAARSLDAPAPVLAR